MQTFFPLVIDNTQFAEFKKCPLSYFRKYNQHLQGAESVHLVAGKAFAAGLEATRKAYWNEGKDAETALGEGMAALEDSYGNFEGETGNKSLDKMLLALDMYFLNYPLDSDRMKPAKLANGEYAIEYSFAVELPIKHPEFDVPLIFAGRADMLVDYCGKLYVEDEKTTSMFTKHFAASWEMRSQFTSYCWALAKQGIQTSGAIVRGIALQKTQIKFAEVISSRTPFEYHLFEKNLYTAVQQMVDNYKAWKKQKPQHAGEIYPMSLGEGCMSYMTPCGFADSCKSPNGERFLEQKEQNIWLPHEQNRMPLHEYLERDFPELLEIGES